MLKNKSEILTFEKLAAKMEPFFGHVCHLFNSEMGVLCGVGADHMDLYYIIQPQGENRKDVWYSAVGQCETLKPHLPAWLYNDIAKGFRSNRALPEVFVKHLNEGDGVIVPYTEAGLQRVRDAERLRVEAQNAKIDDNFENWAF